MNGPARPAGPLDPDPREWYGHGAATLTPAGTAARPESHINVRDCRLRPDFANATRRRAFVKCVDRASHGVRATDCDGGRRRSVCRRAHVARRPCGRAL